MIIRRESWDSRWQRHLDRITKWHRWFAWYPVRLDSYDVAWLQIVWRKKRYGGIGMWSEYSLFNPPQKKDLTKL